MKKFVILCVIWAMVLSSCEKQERVGPGMKARFNKTRYSTINFVRPETKLIAKESFFEFSTKIKLFHKETGIWLSLYLREDSPIELNKTYQLKDVRDKQFGGFCYLEDRVPDFWNPYYYTDGYIIFTKLEPQYDKNNSRKLIGYDVYGEFEFVSEHNYNPSDIVTVTKGEFWDLFASPNGNYINKKGR